MRRPWPLALAALVTACGPTAGTDTVSAFPDGTSTWTGTMMLDGAEVDADATLTRVGEALSGELAVHVMGDVFAFEVEGTVALDTHQLAVRPLDWVTADPGLAVAGASATYDPETGALTGMVRSAVSWDNNVSNAGALTLTTDAAPAAIAPEDIAATALPDEAELSGEMRCTETVRPVTASLSRGSDGRYGGTVSFEEPDGTEVGTYEVDGVAAGSLLTLLPLPWIEDGPAGSYLNFFVHGEVADGRYVGMMTQNIGAACVRNGWDTSVTAAP